MFACLYSLSAPIAALVKIAEDFTPRYEVRGPLVILDISGLSRLFGSPQEIGDHLRRSAGGSPVRIAIAPSETAAVLLALGRAGLTVMIPDQDSEMLASLPVSLLADFDRIRLAGERFVPAGTDRQRRSEPPHVGEMWDSLPYFTSTLERTSELAIKAHTGLPRQPASAEATAVRRSFSEGGSSPPNSERAAAGGGWKHPRDSHAANLTRRVRREVTAPPDTEHPHAAASRSASAPAAPASDRPVTGELRRDRPAARTALAEIQSLSETLRRWGIKTLGAFAALPAGDVYERLGARGVLWQRLAHGRDTSPLVPWVPEEPFEATLELEWPIEGLEPLSFVFGRLLEPLAERLEGADRGAAILHTHLRLVSKEVHARTLELPAPMRDPKTLRTLMLLDLESNPPSAAIDRVRVLIEPTPARVLQWMLFERAQPSPEQVSTLLARLTALMGDTHVGSPRILDTWKPGAFAMQGFQVRSAECGVRSPSPECGVRSPSPECGVRSPSAECGVRSASAESGVQSASAECHVHSDLGLRTSHSDSALRTSDSALSTSHSALRRFRLPVPARVQVQEGRPVKIVTDRRGVTGGAIVQAAGPWRTSGDWWNDAPALLSTAPAHSSTAPHLAHSSTAPHLAHPSTAPHLAHPPHPAHLSHLSDLPSVWDRDEWDVALADGTVYRIYVERDVGQWFVEGVVD